jgi:two-component system, LytTR family, sensor kinase
MFAGNARPAGQMFGLLVIGKLHANLLTYAVIVGAAHLIDYYRKYRDRELRSSRLEAKLARAELEVLKRQLHPHFLFNTLHAVSALMHRDVEAADRMLARLSDLLRLAMEDVGAQEVTLQHEMEFLERYLEIEQTRFADRLRVAVEVAPETLDALVPSLVLQPLVENAIRHGIASRAGGGRLEIRAARDGSALRLEVRDDGPGFPGGVPPKTGVGITNTRARLEQLYGREHRFEMRNRPEGGLEILLLVPFRRDVEGAAP